MNHLPAVFHHEKLGPETHFLGTLHPPANASPLSEPRKWWLEPHHPLPWVGAKDTNYYLLSSKCICFCKVYFIDTRQIAFKSHVIKIWLAITTPDNILERTRSIHKWAGHVLFFLTYFLFSLKLPILRWVYVHSSFAVGKEKIISQPSKAKWLAWSHTQRECGPVLEIQTHRLRRHSI